MEKKIAIAVDQSVPCAEAMHYAAQLASQIPDISFTLLHVMPGLSQYLTDEAQHKQKARDALQQVIRKNRATAEELLDKAVGRMIQAGVAQDRLETMTLARNAGIADDLLTLSQAKSYDAILVGRRGASYLRQWLMGSVTANLVEHSQLVPIWIVDGKPASTRILLAADGSQSSLRALDHMAFVLSGVQSTPLHVVHVQPRFKDYCEIDVPDDIERQAQTVLLDDDRHCMEDFYAKALAVLDKNGLSEDRLQMETIAGAASVSRAVRTYAEEKGFGSIVLGRRGKSASVFTGSVSRSLLNKTSNAALWVVP